MRTKGRNIADISSKREENAKLADYFQEITAEFEQHTKTIREELDEHLESINQNTNEIQANYEFLMEINGKVDKIQERLGEIQLFIEKQFGMKKEEKTSQVILPLTKNEQEVFFLLYTLDNYNSLSYKEIARSLSITENLVQNYIGTLIGKGIPILKKYTGNQTYLCLDRRFKALQAKQNLVNISEDIIKAML